MAQYQLNPPWVDRILNKHWDALVEVSPKPGGVAVMPQIARQTKRGKMSFDELGCGHYGCVIATSEPGLVFKVTSDASEAAFVAAAGQLSDWPAGMVRYHGLYELPDKHRGRRTFVLWRDEAESIGALATARQSSGRDYVKRFGQHSLDEFGMNLGQFLHTAGQMREQLKRAEDPARFLTAAAAVQDQAWRLYVNDSAFEESKLYRTFGHVVVRVRSWYKGPLAFALRRLLAQQVAEMMGSTHAGYLVGQALDYYLGEGILLADVHMNNIGEVQPEDYTSWELVITDPGHMVPLDPKWLQVAIPVLSG